MGENLEAGFELNNQRIGRVAEYTARIAFAQRGYTIYVPDVDDAGVDLLLHRPDVGYLRVQVKSLRRNGYVFMRKRHFQPAADLMLCLVLFSEDLPQVFLVPSLQWESPCATFVSRDYVGLKSEPEYGVNVSAKSRPQLQPFAL
jgi:hypothetical protein